MNAKYLPSPKAMSIGSQCIAGYVIYTAVEEFCDGFILQSADGSDVKFSYGYGWTCPEHAAAMVDSWRWIGMQVKLGEIEARNRRRAESVMTSADKMLADVLSCVA